jgi:hypothetical protein
MESMKYRWVLACGLGLLGCAKQPAIIGTWVDDPANPKLTATFAQNGTYRLMRGFNKDKPEASGTYVLKGQSLTCSPAVIRGELQTDKGPVEDVSPKSDTFICDIQGDKMTVQLPSTAFAMVLRRKSN